MAGDRRLEVFDTGQVEHFDWMAGLLQASGDLEDAKRCKDSLVEQKSAWGNNQADSGLLTHLRVTSTVPSGAGPKNSSAAASTPGQSRCR